MRFGRLTEPHEFPSVGERVSQRVPLLAFLVAIALLVGSVAGFVGTRRSLHDDDERAFLTRAEVVGRRVELMAADLVAAASATGRAIDYARSTGTFVPARDLPAITGPLLATVGVRSARLETAHPTDDPGDPVAAAVLGARARNEPRLAAPARPGGVAVLVVPGYRDISVPPSVDARLAGGGPDLLVGIDVAAMIERALTGSLTLRIRASDAGVPLTAFGPDRGPAEPVVVMRDIDLAGRVWTLTLMPRTTFAGDAVLPWTILGAGLLMSAVALATAWLIHRSAEQLRARTAAREQELALIAEAGPLLQQSLDLADVLPEFVVRISDHFDVERLALLVESGVDGELREVFAVGTAGGRRSARDLPVNPPTAAPAEEFVLRLHRSGRVVGALRIRPRRAVGPAQMQSLVALGDLLAAALGNIQLYADEQESVRRLREVDRLKNDFVSTVSHELRTTTTAIAGFAELLEQQWEALPDDTRRDFLRRVTRNAGTLRLLVDDMLDFSRLDRMTLSVAVAPIDLSATVTTIVDQIASLLGQHVLRREIEPGVRAWNDPRALERILANLLSNAAKFSPPETEVTVTLRRAGDVAELAVADRGPGVAPEDRPQIFTRFYRGNSQAARATRGAGVGLAIVFDLVERLGATIDVDDAPGGGARFVVHFPLQPPQSGDGAESKLPEAQRDPIP